MHSHGKEKQKLYIFSLLPSITTAQGWQRLLMRLQIIG